MGLVNDSVSLAKAGLAPVTGALTLIQGLKNEQECKRLKALSDISNLSLSLDLVWNSAAIGLASILDAWWENKKITDLLNEFRKVHTIRLVSRI